MWRIALLDFCLILLALLFLTQVVVPILFPNSFRIFWLFYKSKSKEDETQEKNLGDNLRQEVLQAIGLKKKTDTAIKKVRKKTEKNQIRCMAKISTIYVGCVLKIYW